MHSNRCVDNKPSDLVLSHSWRPLRLCAKTFLTDWQGEREFAAFAEFALYPDFAAVHFNETPGQRQAESRAFAFLRVVAAGLPKLLEDRLLVFLGDADAGVCDRYDHGAVADRSVDFDLSAFRRELDRVGKEIDQNLLHLALVAGEIAEPLVDRSLDFDAVPAGAL